MLLKFLLKIWPALLPIVLYVLWVLVVEKILKKRKKKGVFEGEFKTVSETEKSEDLKDSTTDNFSLKNSRFVMIIYLSLVLMIICFLFFAIRTPQIEDGKYIPAENKNGKIISGKIIELNSDPKNP